MGVEEEYAGKQPCREILTIEQNQSMNIDIV